MHCCQWVVLSILVLSVCMFTVLAIPSRSFNIGGLLFDNITEQHFTHTLRVLNFDGESVAGETTLYDETTVMSASPLTTALHLCDTLISKGVFAVVVASAPDDSSTTAVVSYTCGFYHIPVICTHTRDSAFSNKNIHASLLRTVPPYSQQADVWIHLLLLFKYQQVIFIHCDDSDGRVLHTHFQRLATKHRDHDKRVKLAREVEFTLGQESFVEILSALREELVKVFILYASASDANNIFHDARYLNMTGSGYVWIVGEQALDAPLAPTGTLGFKLKYANNYQAHITDSLRVAARALRRLHEESEVIPAPPLSCDEENYWQKTGKTLYRLMKSQVLEDGETGKVAFDSHGDRTHAEYTLVNVQPNQYSTDNENNTSFSDTVLQDVGRYFFNKDTNGMELSVNLDRIIWPGEVSTKPAGYALPKHLRVATLREMPFVYARDVANVEECVGFDEEICTHVNDSTLDIGLACCRGFCVDLLKRLSVNNDFTYELFLYPEASYGTLVRTNEDKNEWTGVMGGLLSERDGEEGMDLIVAPLTITPDRAQHIYFTKPFKYHGITILVKKAPLMATLVSILQPFRGTLWLFLLATVHIIAFMLWLVDRVSPKYRNEGDERDSLNISEAFWFSWSVILNSGLTEGTPRSVSGRVLGIAWAGFAMIMVASYTANLAAFLVLEAPISTISGINDPRLRNPAENFTFATVKDSAVDMFFRRKTEWANMYRVMEAHTFTSVDEAVQAVKNGSLQAFIWESSRLEYEASRDCELVTVGGLFGRSGYGIGLKKTSPWADKITLDILDYHERGYMEDLDQKWIWAQENICPDHRYNAALFKRLGLRNLEGIFIMTAGGILSGIILVLAEMAYDKLKNKRPTCGKINNDDNDNIDRPTFEQEEGTLAEKRTLMDRPPAEGEEATPSSGRKYVDNLNSDMDQEAGGNSKDISLTYPSPEHDYEILRDVDERLHSSPHIPEEWKIHQKPHIPIEWCHRCLNQLQGNVNGLNYYPGNLDLDTQAGYSEGDPNAQGEIYELDQNTQTGDYERGWNADLGDYEGDRNAQSRGFGGDLNSQIEDFAGNPSSHEGNDLQTSKGDQNTGINFGAISEGSRGAEGDYSEPAEGDQLEPSKLMAGKEEQKKRVDFGGKGKEIMFGKGKGIQKQKSVDVPDLKRKGKGQKTKKTSDSPGSIKGKEKPISVEKYKRPRKSEKKKMDGTKFAEDRWKAKPDDFSD